MNREILFRAISKVKGEGFVYGDLRHYNHGGCDKWTIHNPETNVETEVEPETIGQYTGLIDKNGNKIFEGDIIKVSEYANDAHGLFLYDELIQLSIDDVRGKLEKEEIAEVKWEEGCFCYNTTLLSVGFGLQQCSMPIFEFEVINNIHNDLEPLK